MDKSHPHNTVLPSDGASAINILGAFVLRYLAIDSATRNPILKMTLAIHTHRTQSSVPAKRIDGSDARAAKNRSLVLSFTRCLPLI